MKTKFRFKYPAAFYIIFAAIYALAALSIVLNGIRLYSALSQSIDLGAYRTLSLVIGLILPIAISVLITAAIINSAYTLTETRLIVNFGFLRENYNLTDVSEVIKNLKTRSLHIIAKDGSSYKIVIGEEDFDDFSSFIVKNCPGVVYGETDEDIKK